MNQRHLSEGVTTISVAGGRRPSNKCVQCWMEKETTKINYVHFLHDGNLKKVDARKSVARSEGAQMCYI